MSHFLSPDQMALLLSDMANSPVTHLGNDAAEALRGLEAALQRAGVVVAAYFEIAITADAETMPGFGDLCIGFGPATEGQDIPSDLREYDPSSDWAHESYLRRNPEPRDRCKLDDPNTAEEVGVVESFQIYLPK